MCPQSNYITTALSWPNMADNPQGGAGLTGLLPWEQRSLPPLPPFLSVCLCGTHTYTQSHMHTRTYTVLQWNLPGFVIRAPLTGGRKHREERRGHSTSVLDGECRLAGYCLFTYCILKQICSPLWTYGNCSLLASRAAGRRYVPHVCFFPSFSCGFIPLSSWKLSS